MDETAQKNTMIKSIWLCNEKLQRSLDAHLGNVHGIGFKEYMLLDLLINAEEQLMPTTALVGSSSEGLRAITKTIMPMEKIGLVSRIPSKQSELSTLIKPTSAGVCVYHDATVTMSALCVDLLQDCDQDELNTACRLLQQLSQFEL